jgi:hypothetical protein
MSHHRRLDQLEAHVGAPDAPTWADARDAADRLRDGARARLAVLLAAHAAGTAAAPRPPAELAEADDAEACLARYCAAQGFDLRAHVAASAPATRARVRAHIARLTGRDGA